MPAKIDAQVRACLREAQASGHAREIPVIVTLRSVADLGSLEENGLRVRQVFAAIAAVSGRVLTSRIQVLASLVNVKRIEYDGEMHALDTD